MPRALYWSVTVGCAVLSAYFVLDAITMGWLGSFPGRDVELYTSRYHWRLVVSGVFLVLAIFVGFRFRPAKGSSPSGESNG